MLSSVVNNLVIHVFMFYTLLLIHGTGTLFSYNIIHDALWYLYRASSRISVSTPISIGLTLVTRINISNHRQEEARA